MITNFIKRIIVIFLALTASFSATSQVVVNEFCFANYSDYVVGGEFEDWVEFYNPTGAVVNIGGYWLSDNVLNPMKYQIPATVTVPPNGYKLILFSGQGGYNPGYLGETNTDFKITQSNGEDLVFSNPAGNILESYDFATISPNQMNHSYGRVPNGSGVMLIQTDPSEGAANTGATATAYADAPVIDTQAGYYASPITVTISSTEPGATIYYTTDGSQPSNTSAQYTGPINISTTSVLRAIAYSPTTGILPSFIETNTYFFGIDNHTIPVVSISGNTLGDGSWNGDELTQLEFFQNGTFVVESHGDSNEHGNDSNAYGQRGFDYITRDALGYDHELEHPMLHTSNRQRYQRLIFKAAANDNYPFSGDGAHVRDAYVCELSRLGDLHLDERKTRSCVVYINGQYWGVYEIREKVDDTDYTKRYYDQPAGNVDFLKTWGGTWTEYAAAPTFDPQTQWNTFVNFVTTNNMATQVNYDYVVSQFNTMSLIDYFILNGYTVCTDWLNWNTAWWRGTNPLGDGRRWRYALWDNDATFGHYVNYTGVPSTQPTADPCQIEGQGDVGGQGHIPVLNALFDNPDFFADYIQRYAELSNTIFSCERMIEVLDSMVLVIEPEMPRQIQRWGGDVTTWNNNVQAMRDFILARCSTEIIGGIADCYDVVPYNVTFQIDGIGDIVVGETELSPYELPFTGTYFGDLEIDLEALVDSVAGPCSSFQGWEIISGNGVIADPTASVTTLIVQSDVTVQAIFGIPTGPVTVLTDVFPAGSGNIVFNGTVQNTYPEIFTVNAGDSTSVSVTANPWFTFNHWESSNAALLPNSTSTSIYLNPCSADTIVAIFDETPHAILQVDVLPVGAGTVTMDGTVLASYPWSNDIIADIDYTFNANEIPGVTLFDHWEINNHPLSPNTLTSDVILHLMVSDTLVAVFTIIDEFPLTVDVQPAGAGSVTMSGTPWTPLPSTQFFSENTFMNFVTSPADSWTTFNHWEINNHLLAPNISSTNVNFNFTEEDTLVAVFDVTPHHALTVMVNPPAAGTVLFDTGNATTTSLTIENEDNIPVNFTALPEPYWLFTGWQSLAGTLINPNLTADQVSAIFTGTDTIVANFAKEPFLYFVPNTFSPNDDDLNEVFIPVLNGYDPTDYHFAIYDRWGIMIFETNNPTKGWNGALSGTGSYYVQNDAYVWKLRVKPIGAFEPMELMGSLTLFR